MVESFVQNTIMATYNVIAEDDEEEEIFAQKSFENTFDPEFPTDLITYDVEIQAGSEIEIQTDFI